MTRRLFVGYGRRCAASFLYACASVGTFAGIAATSALAADDALTMDATTSPATQASQPADGAFSLAPARPAAQELLYHKGKLHYHANELNDAEQSFRAILQQNPDDAPANYYLGLTMLALELPGEAVGAFDAALRVEPNLGEAHLGRAEALTRLGQYREAEAELDKIEGDPQFAAAVEYQRGQIHYAQGQYDSAAASFSKAKDAGGPESGSAGLYEGLTYLQLHDLSRARQAFRDVARIDHDSDVASASRRLESRLGEAGGKPKPWYVELGMGYEYDSNVVLFDTNIPLPENISRRDDGRFVVQPRAGYSFLQNDRFEVGVDTTDYFSWYNDLSAYDVESYQFGVYGNYKIVENVFAGLRYDFNYVRLGHDPFLTRNVVTPQLTFLEPSFGFTAAFYQFDARQYDVEGSDDIDLDGKYHSIGIVQGIDLPKVFNQDERPQLQLSYRYERDDTKGSDFDANIHNAGIRLLSPLPIWGLKADLGAGIAFGDYDHGNSLDANDDKRDDFEYRLSMGISKRLCKNATIRADYSYTNHDSNVETDTGFDPYTYDRHQVGIRLIVSY